MPEGPLPDQVGRGPRGRGLGPVGNNASSHTPTTGLILWQLREHLRQQVLD